MHFAGWLTIIAVTSLMTIWMSDRSIWRLEIALRTRTGVFFPAKLATWRRFVLHSGDSRLAKVIRRHLFTPEVTNRDLKWQATLK